jgi:hypothetical protein
MFKNVTRCWLRFNTGFFILNYFFCVCVSCPVYLAIRGPWVLPKCLTLFNNKQFCILSLGFTYFKNFPKIVRLFRLAAMKHPSAKRGFIQRGKTIYLNVDR